MLRRMSLQLARTRRHSRSNVRCGRDSTRPLCRGLLPTARYNSRTSGVESFHCQCAESDPKSARSVRVSPVELQKFTDRQPGPHASSLIPSRHRLIQPERPRSFGRQTQGYEVGPYNGFSSETTLLDSFSVFRFG